MTSFSLQDAAIRAMLNQLPQEVQPWVEADGCVTFLGLGKDDYVATLQGKGDVRIFLKVHRDPAEKAVLDPTRTADATGKPAVFYRFPLNWLPPEIQEIYDSRSTPFGELADHWTGIDGYPL